MEEQSTSFAPEEGGVRLTEDITLMSEYAELFKNLDRYCDLLSINAN